MQSIVQFRRVKYSFNVKSDFVTLQGGEPIFSHYTRMQGGPQAGLIVPDWTLFVGEDVVFNDVGNEKVVTPIPIPNSLDVSKELSYLTHISMNNSDRVDRLNKFYIRGIDNLSLRIDVVEERIAKGFDLEATIIEDLLYKLNSLGAEVTEKIRPRIDNIVSNMNHDSIKKRYYQKTGVSGNTSTLNSKLELVQDQVGYHLDASQAFHLLGGDIGSGVYNGADLYHLHDHSNLQNLKTSITYSSTSYSLYGSMVSGVPQYVSFSGPVKAVHLNPMDASILVSRYANADLLHKHSHLSITDVSSANSGGTDAWHLKYSDATTLTMGGNASNMHFHDASALTNYNLVYNGNARLILNFHIFTGGGGTNGLEPSGTDEIYIGSRIKDGATGVVSYLKTPVSHRTMSGYMSNFRSVQFMDSFVDLTSGLGEACSFEYLGLKFYVTGTAAGHSGIFYVLSNNPEPNYISSIDYGEFIKNSDNKQLKVGDRVFIDISSFSGHTIYGIQQCTLESFEQGSGLYPVSDTIYAYVGNPLEVYKYHNDNKQISDYRDVDQLGVYIKNKGELMYNNSTMVNRTSKYYFPVTLDSYFNVINIFIA